VVTPFDDIFTQQYLYKNYWNRTTIVEIIVGGWVASFLRHTVEWMWANTQRDGRPAEYSWRPLFNGAKFG